VPHVRRFIRITAASAFVLASLAPSLSAQNLRGVVRDSATRQPIPGAVVQLLDSSGVMLSRNITDEGGRFGVAVALASRWVRVVRIGFQPRELRLPANWESAASFDVGMIPVSTMLAAIRVEAQSDCPRRSDDANTLGLWEQARAGLLATVVAREANPAAMDRLVFERRFDGHSDRPIRFSVAFHASDRADQSFNAAFPAKVFVDSGFAADSAGVQILFGPDAEVLLDETFARAYCFRLAPPARDRAGQVGLAFSPAQRQPGRVDIDGTLWVDTAARALTDIEFRYVGLPHLTVQFAPGGRISFRQMDNGMVLIDRWHLRGAVASSESPPSADIIASRGNLSAIEFGGELARVSWPDGHTWRASLGRLRVHAVNGSGQPAAGAIVVLRDTHYKGAADSNGDIVIDDLLPGPYWLQVFDETLDNVALSIPTPVRFVAVRDSTVKVTLTVPTAEEYVVSRCIAAHQWKAGSNNLILGRVVDSSSGPVSGARISYAVKTPVGDWRSLDDNFTTGIDGVFQSCNPGFTRGATIRTRVHRQGVADTDAIVTLSARLTVVPVQAPMRP
jgi:hypothetical protein